MKNIFGRACIALAAALALAACGAGGNAYAGSLSQNFVGDSGNVFEVSNALTVEKVAGAVQVLAVNGTVYSYPDSTGALYTKLVNWMAGSGHYFQVSGTFLHMNTTAAHYIGCYNGNQSIFAYPGNNPARFFADGCSLYNAIKAQAN